MFRKFFAVVVAAMLVVGGVFADEIKGMFKKFEDGKVTIAVDGKESTYKVDPEAKFKRKKDGTEVELTKMFGFLKEGQTVTLTVEKDLVVKAVPEFKKKKDN